MIDTFVVFTETGVNGLTYYAFIKKSDYAHCQNPQEIIDNLQTSGKAWEYDHIDPNSPNNQSCPTGAWFKNCNDVFLFLTIFSVHIEYPLQELSQGGMF